MDSFICSICKQEKEKQSSAGTGYAINDKKEKICYSCCADEDKKYMRENKRIMLYLDIEKRLVTNWPGTLKINLFNYRKGRHNFSGQRIDVWFYFENTLWHGVNYGYNSQCVHCKQVKGK